MITLIRRLRRLARAHDFLVRQDEIIDRQFKLLSEQQRQLRWLQLQHYREIHEMSCAWIISIETPEIDIRHDLHEMERKLRNQIATLEEHVL